MTMKIEAEGVRWKMGDFPLPEGLGKSKSCDVDVQVERHGAFGAPARTRVWAVALGFTAFRYRAHRDRKLGRKRRIVALNHRQPGK